LEEEAKKKLMSARASASQEPIVSRESSFEKCGNSDDAFEGVEETQLAAVEGEKEKAQINANRDYLNFISQSKIT
jgi:hypothetical protein